MPAAGGAVMQLLARRKLIPAVMSAAHSAAAGEPPNAATIALGLETASATTAGACRQQPDVPSAGAPVTDQHAALVDGATAWFSGSRLGPEAGSAETTHLNVVVPAPAAAEVQAAMHDEQPPKQHVPQVQDKDGGRADDAAQHSAAALLHLRAKTHGSVVQAAAVAAQHQLHTLADEGAARQSIQRHDGLPADLGADSMPSSSEVRGVTVHVVAGGEVTAEGSPGGATAASMHQAAATPQPVPPPPAAVDGRAGSSGASVRGVEQRQQQQQQVLPPATPGTPQRVGASTTIVISRKLSHTMAKQGSIYLHQADAQVGAVPALGDDQMCKSLRVVPPTSSGRAEGGRAGRSGCSGEGCMPM